MQKVGQWSERPEKCTDLISTFRVEGNFGIWEEHGMGRGALKECERYILI